MHLPMDMISMSEKNNYQNDELTLRWQPETTGGSTQRKCRVPMPHCKTNGDELPDHTTFEEAGRLAAHILRSKEAGKVEIDYHQRENVKKPNGKQDRDCGLLHELLNGLVKADTRTNK